MVYNKLKGKVYRFYHCRIKWYYNSKEKTSECNNTHYLQKTYATYIIKATSSTSALNRLTKLLIKNEIFNIVDISIQLTKSFLTGKEHRLKYQIQKPKRQPKQEPEFIAFLRTKKMHSITK